MTGCSSPRNWKLLEIRPIAPGRGRLISIFNQKGGVAKTTTAVNLAAGLALRGHKVLVIDLDPQSNATTGLGVDHRSVEYSTYDLITGGARFDQVVRPTDIPGLHVVPSSVDLEGAEIELVGWIDREKKLAEALEGIETRYEVMFIDCPPSLGLLTINALAASADLIIPVQCEYYALEGLGQLLARTERIRRSLNTELRISGFLLTMFDARTNLSTQVANDVRGQFGELVLDTIIPRSVRISESPSFGKPVLTLDPSSRGAVSFRLLAAEVEARYALEQRPPAPGRATTPRRAKRSTRTELNERGRPWMLTPAYRHYDIVDLPRGPVGPGRTQEEPPTESHPFELFPKRANVFGRGTRVVEAAPRLVTVPDTGKPESPFWYYWRLTTRSLAIALGAVVVGAGLAASAWRFGNAGPLVLLGAVLLPLLALAVVNDPRTGLVAVFLTFGVSSGVATSLGSLPFQLVELAVLGMVTLIALRRISAREGPLGWHAGLWWGVAIVAWALIALPSSADLKLGMNQVASLGGGVVFAAAVIAATRTERDVRVVLGWFVAVAAGIALLALTYVSDLQSSYGGAVVSGRLQGAFDQPNQLGSFSAMGIPLALGFALGGRSTLSRAFGWLAGAALFGSLLLSLSRGAWIGMTLATLYLLVVLPEARRRLALTLIPLILLAAGVGAFLPRSPQVEVVGQRLGAITSHYDGRTEIWDVAQEQIRADPLTGQGPGSFPVTSARASSGTVTVSADHAHNIWLTWAAEMGIPSVLLLTGLMAALAFAARRSSKSAIAAGDEEGLAFGTCLTAALITLAGQGLVDYTWRNQVLFVAIATLVGASFALAQSREKDWGSEGASAGDEGKGVEEDIGLPRDLLHTDLQARP